jgi:YD repeat-containing protein
MFFCLPRPFSCRERFEIPSGAADADTSSLQHLGNLTQTIDPFGRITNLALDNNGIDVVQISRVTGEKSSDVLATFRYNSQHLPLMITDAAGQTTVLVYNSAGQVLSITDPKQRRTTFTYNHISSRGGKQSRLDSDRRFLLSL